MKRVLAPFPELSVLHLFTVIERCSPTPKLAGGKFLLSPTGNINVSATPSHSAPLPTCVIPDRIPGISSHESASSLRLINLNRSAPFLWFSSYFSRSGDLPFINKPLPLPMNEGRMNVSLSSGSDDDVTTSLRRSRKRFLSPSVLRGDQAVDRLLAQESSASPLLKKQKPTEGGKMALTAEFFEKYMENNFKKDLKELKGTVDKIDGSVRANTEKLDRHEGLIASNAEKLERMNKEVEAIKASGSSSASTWTALGGLPQDLSNKVGEAEYLKARKSLRLWPIRGLTPEEVWKSTGDFLHVLLGLPSIGEDKIANISRPTMRSGFGVIDEAVVLFKEIDTRDSVIGAASKLSGRINELGKPTAGIRLEIPASLRVDFNTLRKFGLLLKKRHGQGTKHHVKFDDGTKSLFLNVRLPDDEYWTRIDTDLARRSVLSRHRLDSQEIEARLDINGRTSGPRRASESTAPNRSSSSSQPMQWTGRRTESLSS